GRVRDLSGLVKVSFAAYCRGTCAHHCALRIRSIDTPVNIGGVLIRPGDIIHADNEGVITLREMDVASLLEAAPKLVLAEREVQEVWRREDISIADKRKHAAKIYNQYDFTM